MLSFLLKLSKPLAKSLEPSTRLHLQAKEQRPDALITTIPLMVTVSGMTEFTTTTTEDPGGAGGACDEDLERKYFISMIVLGACLGGLLTALFIVLLCLCCKR